MSNEYLNMVWDYTAKNSGQKVVLLALADHADKEGFCFPGIDRLATKTGLKARMVQKHLETLKSDGVIEIYYNQGTKTASGYTNKYRLLRGALQYTPIDEGVQPSTPQEVHCSTPQGVQPSTPKPPVQPPVKPNTNGNGKTLPLADEKPKPLTVLSDRFISASGVKLPTRKTDVKFWWSSIRELYNLADKDIEVATKLIEYSIKKLRADELTISDPNSLIKTARATMAARARQIQHKATITANGGAYL